MQNVSFPRRVARRILERAEQGDRAVVVTLKNRRPTRVFGLEEYLRQREVPRKHEIWKQRKRSEGARDPLDARDLGIRGPLRREDIYD